MSSQSSDVQNIVRDLSDVANGKTLNQSQIFQDVYNLRHNDNNDSAKLKADLMEAGKSLQASGVLPAVEIGALGGAAGVEAIANRAADEIAQGHIFAAIGDVVSLVQPPDKSGKEKLDKSRQNNVHYDQLGRVTEVDYPNGTRRQFQYAGNSNIIIQYTEPNGDTYKRKSDGTYTHYGPFGNKLKDGLQITPFVDTDGTLVVSQKGGETVKAYLPDNSSLTYDQAGNLTEYQYPDGRNLRYTYKNGLISEVCDTNGQVWKRNDKGSFDQLGPDGKPTGVTESGAAFIPPMSDTNLYQNDRNSAFDRLTHDLLDAIWNGSGPYPQPGGDGPNPNGVAQGQLGDCYFLSAVGSLAQEDPQAIKNMIKDNGDGTYTVTFPGDPKHPVTVQAPTAEETAKFAQDQNGAYVAILEKAHRYYTGKVTEDNGGDPAEALHLLTGKNYQDVDMHSTQWGWQDLIPGVAIWDWLSGNNQMSDQQVGQLLENALSKGQPVTAATGGSGTDLVTDHAYSVLGYDPKTQTVTVRNPWDFLGFDPKKIPSLHDLGNGEFTMSLADFHREFSEISIQSS